MNKKVLFVAALILAIVAVAAWRFIPSNEPDPMVWRDAPGAPEQKPADLDMMQKVRLAAKSAADSSDLKIEYPLDETLFPPDFPAPTVLFNDETAADSWLVEISPAGGGKTLAMLTLAELPMRRATTPPDQRHPSARDYRPSTDQLLAHRFKPAPEIWSELQRRSTSGPAKLAIFGFRRKKPSEILSRGVVSIATSTDPVGAPIFYRDVPLPFIHAFNNTKSIRWRLGDVTSPKPPPVLLTDMKVCGNCHSFTPDGKTLAMDVDYGNDKGSYVIADIEPTTVLSRDKVISWSDYKRPEGDRTFGLLSQISPDGRYVASTVKDRAVFSPTDDLFYSQRFFPVKGILAIYDRQKKSFAALSGADDRKWVQSNPVWSGDGKTILFARAKAHELAALKDHDKVLLQRTEAREFFEGGRKLLFDICRIPFNEGRGGKAELLAGASANGKSNYFPRFSPDGKWIVFCQSESFMLLRPHSRLYIMPAEGGQPRKMRCNHDGKMNSWHSFSPNGRWLVFASKARGPYTQLWLTHVAEDGSDTPAVLLEEFTDADRAANIPEFVNVAPEKFASIRQEFADHFTYYFLARKHAVRKEFDKAIAEAQRAIAEKPDHADSLYLIASCLARTEREAKAVPYARRALAADDSHWKSRRLLGGIYSRDGRYNAALSMLARVLANQPGDRVTLNNLTWLLATCPDKSVRDGARAVEYGKQVCDATDNSVPPMLDSLAAAYAETGKFDLAIETLGKAIGMYKQNRRAIPRELELRMQLYRQRKPYREGPAPR